MRHIAALFLVLICCSAFAQPANDLCSGAQVITPNGSCVSGTTLAAADNWTGTVGCQTAGGTHPDAWYSFVSTGNSYVGTVTTSGSWSGTVEFTLVSGDCINGFALIGSACGASPLSINIPGLNVGTTYYFTISEKGAANAGPFSVCSSTPLATIPSNDDCSTPVSLGTLPAPGTCGTGVQNGTAVVVAGTNVAATEETPYVTLTGCGMASPANSVWYRFVQPTRGYGVTINVSGGTLANPNIALWSGTSCASLSGVNCIVGSGNAATLTVSNGMIPGQTYYIQISGNTGESGTYNLSVNAFQDCSDCLSASSLTVSPLPVNGMYNPGQTVNFCFHIDRWTQTVNNWLHGVQMSFGPGWDLTTLSTTPPPAYVSTSAYWGAVSPGTCGNWAYYPSGTTSSASGVLWPPGFYFDGVYVTDIFGYVIGCGSLTGNPGNNFGDGVPASGLVITPPANQWNFCWSVKVKSGCNPGMSLSVAVNTSGDGESGSWTSIGCSNDPTVNFTAQISCCPPTMSSTGTCAGQSTGTATATPDGLAAPYTYSWSAGGQNTQTITGLAAGTYTVTVIDANACSATASVTVATNANPTVLPTASPAAICAGASTTLAANATAGSGSISSYAWSSGLAGSVAGGSVSPSGNTTYTVTVTNSNTCTATGSISVTVNANPTLAPTVAPAILCNGESTTLAANATAGSGSISSYAWSSGLAGNVSGGSISPTGNTTYIVTVTNSNTCTATGSVAVTVNANPTVAPTAAPAAICNGASTTLAANATAGSGSISTYSWSSGLAGNVSGGSVSPTGNTTYTVTVTNSNTCTATGSVAVTVNANPTVAPTASPSAICAGASTTLAANATAGSGSISTYAWSSGLAGNVSGGSVSPSGNTTYTITVTNSYTCTATGSVAVTINAKPTVAPIATPAAICNGGSTTLAANATAGSGSISTYAWSSGLAGNVSGGSVSPTGNTTYTVTVTNSNTCTATGSVAVTVNANPTVAPTASPSAICAGASTTLAANATAGSGSISTYAWSSGLAGNVSGGSVAPAGNTTYTVTVTNSNTCTATGSITVTVNTNPTVAPTPAPAVICNGGSTTLAANATAGSGSISTYAWSSGLAGNVPGGSVSPTANTTYTVTVTNSNTCTATGSVAVTVNANPTLAPTASPSAICAGASTTLAANATAGSGSISTYAWSSGLAGNVSGGGVAPAGNTTYTVTVTNSNTCTATGSVVVTVNANPTVAPIAAPSAICAGASTTLSANATAGSGSLLSYAWSTGLAGNVAGGSVSPTGNTTYTVTVTNSNTCTATGSVAVIVNANPTVAPTAAPLAICAGTSTTLSANATAGSGSISSYAWSSGLAGNVSGGNVSPTGSTTYTVTVINSNTCTATGSVTVTVNANPTVAPTAAPAAICNGGSTTLAANAAAGSGSISTYTWSSGLAGNVSGGSISPSGNTTYTVTVTNSNTCTATGNVSIIVNANPTVGPTASPAVICNGASTTLTANAIAGSGSISNYSWSSGLAGNVSGGSISPSGNTTYTVTVTNSNTCTATGTVTVTVNANPSVAPTTAPSAICNGTSTILAANATAGSGSISNYSWSSGLTGNVSGGSISPSGNTTYTVTVTNSNTCTATGTVTVTVNANPSVAPTAAPSAICNGASTILAANATAGSGSISTYAWSSGLAGNVSGGSVWPGANTTYTVTVTNSNACTATGMVAIVVNPLPTPSAANTGPYCATATIQLSASGGTSYSWSGPSAFIGAVQNPTRANATLAMAGTYTVTATDANGCSATATTNVVVNSSLTPVASNTGPYCVGGVIQLNVAGGNSYTWSGPNSFSSNSQSPSISNASAGVSGSYTVTATDLNGCSGTASTVVAINSNPTVAPAASPVAICNGASTTLAANATAGSGSIATYVWSGGLAGNVSGGGVSPTGNTTYTVTVTNSNACTATGSVAITVNANPSLSPTAAPAIICNGSATILFANAVAGSGGITTYAWSAGLAGNVSGGSVSPGVNTNYTVTVFDNNGCTASGSVNVTVNANPTVTPSVAPGAICVGSTATLSANALAGSGAITTYAWNSGLAGNVSGGSVSPASNTTYTVTVTNSNSCTATGFVTLVVSDNPTATPTVAPPAICRGQSTALAANATAGSGSISAYSWSSGLAGNVAGGNVSPVTNTTYTVTVTNSNNCTATAMVSVVVNDNPTAVPTLAPGVICNGGSTTLSANATAGSGSISTYAWSSGLAGNVSGGSVSPTVNTTYTVTVTNSNNCTISANASVTVNPLPVPVAGNTGPYCVGNTVQLNASGANTYLWSGPNAYSSNTQNPTPGPATLNMGGNYTVTATDANGCSATASANVIVNALPVPVASNTGPYCIGTNIQLNANGGTGYNWGGPLSFSSTVQGPSIAGATLAMGGNYVVTVTDLNGCSATANTTVIINNALVPVASNTGPYCAGTTVQVNVVGGTSFSWSGPNIFTSTLQNPVLVNSTVGMGGIYSVTATDANGCSGTAATTVVVNAVPVATASNTGPYCAGVNVQLNATGGNSYTWNGPNTFTNFTQNPVLVAATVAMSGVYSVTVTDVNNCSGTASTAVVVHALPTPSASNTGNYCANETIQLNSNGGATYSWSGPSSFNSAVQNPSLSNSITAMSGLYVVTVTDVNSCSATASTVVTVNANPTVSPGALPAIICFGETASLSANATSGSGTVTTYSWSAGLTGNVPGGSVTPGVNTVYTVTVINSNACSVSGGVSVTVNQLPQPTAVNNGPLCVGATLQFTSSGGSLYAWSGPNGYSSSLQNPSIINAGIALTGAYIVTVTDGNNCSATASTNVLINNALVPAASNTGPYCPGAAIQLVVTGGVSYSWSGPLAFTSAAQSPTISGATTGMTGLYTVTATDANGCSGTASTAVTVNAQPVPLATNTGPYCQGAPIQLNGAGGTTYAWSGPVGFSSSGQSPVINNAAVNNSGVYTVTVTNAANCSATASTTITVVPAMIIQASAVDVSCNGGSNGAINVTVGSGQPPYSFLWSNGAVTQNISGLSAANYTVTVTDNAGCTATAGASVTQPAILQVNETHTDVLCNGAATGSVIITASGGTLPYLFSWNDGVTAQNRSNLPAGNYAVTVTDGNGCSGSLSIVIAQPSLLTVAEGHTNVLCNGGATGTITINITGGTFPFSYAWNDGVATPGRSNLIAGSYTLTVTDNNTCTAIANVGITEPAAQNVNETHIDVACGGATPGSITITNSGGVAPYNYLWNDGVITAGRTNVVAGNYSLTVTDNNACTATIAVVINTGSGMALNLSHTDALCFSSADGTISTATTGGTSPYTYAWNDGAVTQNRINLSAGNYTVTVYDNTTCSVSATIIIAEPPVLNVSVTHTDVACFGANSGAVNLSVVGGTAPYAFTWNDGITSQNRTGLTAGSYTVTVTDGNSCTISAAAVVIQPTILNVSATHTDVLCFGGSSGSINLLVSGGVLPYSFNWADGSILQNPINLNSGGYSVTVTDDNLCSVTANIIVGEPTVLSVSETHTDVLCNGINSGTINLTVAGGVTPYIYLWNDGVVTQSRTNIIAGNYTVTVTDSNGCFITLPVIITEPAALTVNETHTNILCNAQSIGAIDITTNGGTVPYVFSWSDAVAIEDRVNIPAGSYTLTVTDGHSCSTSLSVAIIEPAALSISETHVNVACNGGSTGSIDVTASGATPVYTYSWNDGVSSQDRTNLPAGNYALTVTDNNSCTASLSVVINSASGLGISETHTNVTCNGLADGGIAIAVNGGTPTYTYLWNDGVATQNRTNIVAGNYTVTVTDNNGCFITLPVIITEPAALTVNETHTNILCNAQSTGAIDITTNGGTVPYVFGWSDAVAIEDRVNIPAGSYTLTVTDGHSCSTSLSVAIAEPAPIELSETHADVRCYGGATAIIDLTATGGTSPYLYQWNDAATTQDRTGINAGGYSVTTTDANACTAVLSIAIVQPAEILLAEVHDDVLCYNGNNGQINLTVTGGSRPYTFIWNTGASAEDPANMIAGSYTVTVTDNNSCSSSLSVALSQPSQISLIETQTNVSCNGYNDGGIVLSVSGGTPGYTYRWNDGVALQNRPGLSAGSYQVTVTDANLCTAVTSAEILQPPGMALNSSFVNPTCLANVPDGSILLRVTGGAVPYSYSWSNGANTESLATLGAGVYQVTVADDHTCTISAVFVLSYQYDFSVQATPSVTINIGESTTLGYTLTGIAGNYASVWSPSSTLDCISCVSPVAAPVVTTTYQILVTNEVGCKAFDMVTVYVVPDYSVFVPNVFTPNGDGNNDVFEIYGNLKGLAFMEVQIFNRWGEKVFESNDHHFKWDGTFKGTMQNPAVFVWQLKLSFLDGHKEELRKGSVTLVR